jgi:hypothetical protein
MLAFTMQFSKHERTPTHTTTKPPSPTAKTRTSPPQQARCGMEAGPAPHAQTHPTNQAKQARSGLKTQTPNKPDARSLRTQQCDRTPAAPRDGFPEPTADGEQYSHPETNQANRIASAPLVS